MIVSNSVANLIICPAANHFTEESRVCRLIWWQNKLIELRYFFSLTWRWIFFKMTSCTVLPNISFKINFLTVFKGLIVFSMLGRYLVRRSPFLFFKTCRLCGKSLHNSLHKSSHRFLLSSELIGYTRACATWGSMECTNTRCRGNLAKSASQNLQECFLSHCLFPHPILISLYIVENYCHC